MDGEGYPMVASHDPQMIAAAQAYASRSRPRQPTTTRSRCSTASATPSSPAWSREGDQVRTYMPFGDEWYGYFMRRLAERPANLMFFLRSLVSRN